MRQETPRANGRGRGHRPVIWPENSYGVQLRRTVGPHGPEAPPDPVRNAVIVLEGPGLANPVWTAFAVADGIEAGAACVAVAHDDRARATVCWSCHPAYTQGQQIDLTTP